MIWTFLGFKDEKLRTFEGFVQLSSCNTEESDGSVIKKVNDHGNVLFIRGISFVHQHKRWSYFGFAVIFETKKKLCLYLEKVKKFKEKVDQPLPMKTKWLNTHCCRNNVLVLLQRGRGSWDIQAFWFDYLTNQCLSTLLWKIESVWVSKTETILIVNKIRRQTFLV